MSTKRDEAKVARLIGQATRLYGMTRREATEWAFGQMVADGETAARNATLVTTYASETLGCAVTVPAR